MCAYNLTLQNVCTHATLCIGTPGAAAAEGKGVGGSTSPLLLPQSVAPQKGMVARCCCCSKYRQQFVSRRSAQDNC